MTATANRHETDTDPAHAHGAHSPAQEAAAHAPAHGPGAAEHGEGHEGGHGEHPPELENFWNLLARSRLNDAEEMPATHAVIKHFDIYVDDSHAATVHATAQNIFFAFLTIGLVIFVFARALKRRAMIPGRGQSAVEMLIEGLYKFFMGILGEKHGRRYMPFLIALFLFILFNNLMGMVPLMKSSTNAFQCNIALGICVFLYVQYTGLRYNGPKKYFLHLMGNPQGVVMWMMMPLLLLLEIVGEIVKPISLSLRLFGNVLGEDILLGVFAGLGITVTALLLKPVGIEHPIAGIPLQLPFMFLALLTSTIQALIFSLLSSVYILLMLPHDEEAH